MRARPWRERTTSYWLTLDSAGGTGLTVQIERRPLRAPARTWLGEAARTPRLWIPAAIFLVPASLLAAALLTGAVAASPPRGDAASGRPAAPADAPPVIRLGDLQIPLPALLWPAPAGEAQAAGLDGAIQETGGGPPVALDPGADATTVGADHDASAHEAAGDLASGPPGGAPGESGPCLSLFGLAIGPGCPPAGAGDGGRTQPPAGPPGPGQQPTATPTATDWPAPTATLAPTSTPLPMPTLPPTATRTERPSDSASPAPTATPDPTATATPTPTETPADEPEPAPTDPVPPTPTETEAPKEKEPRDDVPRRPDPTRRPVDPPPVPKPDPKPEHGRDHR